MSSHHIIKALPITTFLSSTGPNSAKDILARDRARATKLIAGLQPHGPQTVLDLAVSQQAGSIDVTDAGVTYTMQVGVGSPSTDYTLLIDTGSSNTWVGADKKYRVTETSVRTNASVNVSYGSGKFTGNEFVDRVTLGPGLAIEKQSIGVATSAQGFQGVDGILGYVS